MKRLRGRTHIVPISVLFIGLGMAGTVAMRSTHTGSADSSDSKVKAVHVVQQHPSAPQQALQPEIPIALRIPALHIDTTVTSAGLNKKGEMETPTDRLGVTWYKYGYVPGAPGNAVMAGHSDYKGSQAVFGDLEKLAPNDIIEVVTANTVLTFAVQDKQLYNSGELQPALFASAKEPRLNLITCDGVWDARKHQYTRRLVVSSSFIKETPR